MISTNTAEAIQAIVTSVGILFTGAWVFWKWSLSEFIRKRREIPSFDGDMHVKEYSSKTELKIISVSCVWRNVGSVPLAINSKTTRYRIFRIPETLGVGAFGPRMDNLEELHVRYPWEHWSDVILEPGTGSELQAHFLVEPHEPLLIECRLEGLKKKGQVWVREIIFEPKKTA